LVKSTDGGAHWSVVDHPANFFPTAVTGDGSGNVFVAGRLITKVLTGYAKGHKPIYSSTETVSLRQSLGGNSGTWSESDDPFPALVPYGIGEDFAGNAYIAGSIVENSIDHAVIYRYASGSWSTSDDYAGPDGSGAAYECFAVDSSGNLYAGGGDPSGTLVRSMAGPAPATLATPNFSSTTISATTTPGASSILDPAASFKDLLG
jgi:hypothetical protein